MSMSFRDMPIRRKLMTVILLTSGAVLMLSCAGFCTYEMVALRKGMLKEYTTGAQIIAANSTASLAFRNEADAAEVLAAFKTDPRVVEACLYDQKGKVLARYPAGAPVSIFPTHPSESGYRQDHLEIFYPVLQGSRVLGTVFLQSDLSDLSERYYAYAWLAGAIIACSILLAYLLSRMLQKQISTPVLGLVETAKLISQEGDFSVRAEKSGEDEVGALTDAFNQVLARVEDQEQAIRKLNADLEERIVERTAELALTGRKLEENKNLLDSVLHNIKDGIVAVDEKGRYFVFNPAAEKIMGRTPEGILDNKRMEHFGLFRPDGVTPFPESEGVLSRALRGLETHDLEMFVRNPLHPDGLLIITSGRPLLDEKGKTMGGVGIFRDVTEQKRQENLKIYAKALENSNRELQDFIFVASHDLQEPLRKIQSYGNFLLDETKGSLSEAASVYLARIQTAAKRMSGLIEDLLQLTRVTTKAKPFELVNVSEIVGEVQADLELKLRETGGKIMIGELPELEADPTQMRQLFQNLISNALKYRKADVAPVVMVQGKADEGKGWCRVLVRDNGIGFDPKYSEKIFNIFQRLHANDEYEGTGIGLAICRKVVERHSGTITARGEVGKGAEFEIVLPIKQAK